MSSRRSRSSSQQKGSSRPPRRSSFACNPCRVRKLRCDGKRPQCGHCGRLEKSCEYLQQPSINDMMSLEAYCNRLEAELQHFRTQGTPNSRQPWHASSLPPREQSLERNQQRLVDQTRFQRSMEMVNLCLAAESVPELSTDDFVYLLECHWSFIHPFYSILYRPVFTRELASSDVDGSISSLFLLYAVLTHATRFNLALSSARFWQQSAIFQKTAARLLIEELEKPSKVVTIQGLLLLSGVSFSAGKSSQAWTYGGMAFRQLIDLGLHVEQDETEGEGKEGKEQQQEKVEVRRRIYWACYLWDKCLSLYFARPPTLTVSSSTPKLSFVDDSTEHEEWKPVGLASANEEMQTSKGPTMAVSCFTHACHLAQILERILTASYGEQDYSDTQRAGLAAEAEYELKQWKVMLPANLCVIELPHVINLHCLYHTCIILSSRLSPNPNGLDRAVLSAEAILTTAKAARLAYGQYRFTIAAFSVSTAVSVLVEDLQTATEGPLWEQVLSAIDLVESIADFCPGISAHLDVKTQLSRLQQMYQNSSPAQRQVSEQPSDLDNILNLFAGSLHQPDQGGFHGFL